MKRWLITIAAVFSFALGSLAIKNATPVSALTNTYTEKCIAGSPHLYKITWNTASGNTTTLRNFTGVPQAYATGPGYAYAFTNGWYGWYVTESPSGLSRSPGAPPNSYVVPCS